MEKGFTITYEYGDNLYVNPTNRCNFNCEFCLRHNQGSGGSIYTHNLWLKRGWYLGFDGPITYKNAKRAPEVAAITPLDRILVETDAPYLTPVPYRGKRNDSRYLPYVIEKLAEWKGVTAEEMTDITWENGKRLFGLE